MNIFGITDIGPVRDNNEDCFGIFDVDENNTLAVVCDGMGGENSGEIASRLALETFAGTVLRICRLQIKTAGYLELGQREAELIFSNAVSRANTAVFEYQKEHGETAGMGTTLVAALMRRDGSLIAWVNVGDSRLYTIDKKDILQVTKDHSYIQYMIDVGEITLAEAENHPKRHLITRAIGIGDTVEPDIDVFALSEEERKETRILLCSDGLYGAVKESDCMNIVNGKHADLHEKIDTLLAAAKKDGNDNITAILAEFT